MRKRRRRRFGCKVSRRMRPQIVRSRSTRRAQNSPANAPHASDARALALVIILMVLLLAY